MVKLRSRLIRTPSRGGSSSNQSQSRRRNNHSSSQQGGGDNPADLAARRSQQRQHQSTSNNTNSDEERRPLEALDASEGLDTTSRSRSRSRSRSLVRRTLSSPGKRKPDSRGITASIRRAKTAMIRMASSGAGGRDRDDSDSGRSNNTNTARAGNASLAFQRMDTDGPSSLHHPPRVLRASSQEENVPPHLPMALLSPNCGTSYYAHAAAAAAKCEVDIDDSNIGMDIDDLAMAVVPAATNAVEESRKKNVLEWMGQDAPPELLPKMLSFLGSRKVAALSKVNKAWNETIMKDESVWRVLCEDTHKWSEGDEVPKSWAHHYKSNPIVPIDYDSLEAAFDAISSGPSRDTIENHVAHRYREQRQSTRILLYPGPYFLRRPIVANVIGDAELTIEAISSDVLKDPEHGMTWRRNYHGSGGNANLEEDANEENQRQQQPPAAAYYNHSTRSMSMEARRPSSPTLRQMFGCGRRSSSSAALDTSINDSSSDSGYDADTLGYGGVDSQSEHRAEFHRSCFKGPGRPTSLLCLESRRENEPVIRIRQGKVNLRGLKVVHYCEGTDIWNGNAAIQVQRAFGRNGRPLRVESPSVVPTANLDDCDIMSLSGRGVVVIDGAASSIHDCNVHGSAATGVYVGGGGSMASMTRTDVVENGNGNTRNVGRGVARGHSGVYVEQGLATLQDCNISRNTLTGISAVSTVQARLQIEGSHICGNRSDQMELPSPESGRSVNRNNVISRAGDGRPRSKQLRESLEKLETPRGQRSTAPGTPQSPLE